MSTKKKIISFSVWGNNPKYVIGAIRNAELGNKFFRGWICRFYIGRSTLTGSPNDIQLLKSLDNVEVISMEEEGDWTGMFWRFYPIADEDVGVMISRDADARLSRRDFVAVNEWIKSPNKFHIIRDHPYHSFKIMGGMWGAKEGILQDMRSLIKEFDRENYWQIDQNFLAEVIYPRIKDDAFVHDEFGEGALIKKARKNFEFIGDVFDENDTRDDLLWREIQKERILRRKNESFKKILLMTWKKMKTTW